MQSLADLDSTFCSFFHQWKASIGTPATKLAGQLVLFSLTGAAAFFTFCQLFFVLKKQCTRQVDWRERYHRSIEQLAKWSLLGTACRLVLMITPTLFYLQIFTPCFDCYDFEAAATHEVGHLLGLGHPDQVGPDLDSRSLTCTSQPELCGPPGQNVEYRSSALFQVANVSCLRPFDDLVVRTEEGVRPAIMKSFTQHTPKVCLEADDLEALFALYPQCSHRITTPVCFKSEHNIGWVRLGVYFLFPVILALFVVLLLYALSNDHHVRRLQSARGTIARNKSEIKHEQRRRAGAEHAARVLQEDLATQLATEDSRVQARVQSQVVEEVSIIVDSIESLAEQSRASRTSRASITSRTSAVGSRRASASLASASASAASAAAAAGDGSAAVAVMGPPPAIVEGSRVSSGSSPGSHSRGPSAYSFIASPLRLAHSARGLGASSTSQTAGTAESAPVAAPYLARLQLRRSSSLMYIRDSLVHLQRRTFGRSTSIESDPPRATSGFV